MGLIPARAGSKGLPGKNIRYFGGAPLWRRAAEVAEVTCDDWFVSTDDPLIEAPGYRVERPPELAQDDTPMVEVVKHFCTVVQCDLIVLLQPTQPLRRTEHVRAALALMESGADSVVSVCEIPAHMSPDYACHVATIPSERMQTLGSLSLDVPRGPTRRQDTRPAYYRDGTVYVLRPEIVARGSLYGEYVVPLVIPPTESCSIDTEEDWARAEWMASR